MRGPGRLQRVLCTAWLAFALAALGACAAPAANSTTPAGTDPAAAAGQATPAPTAPAGSKRPMRTGGPLPATRVEPPVAIDATCRTDADCTVKNVGNCCGEYPACVNVNSPVDPEGVKAECARKGMASVCGFQEISACSCNAGHCEAAADGVQ